MGAYNGFGNPTAVDATMHRLTTLLEDDVEPFESVQPETRELYYSLIAKQPKQS
jgi:hypothetical protein